MKKVLSLLICLCMIFSLSVTVLGVSFSNSYVNSYCALTQRVVANANSDGSVTIDIFASDGENIQPAIIQGYDDNGEVIYQPFEFEDYCYSGILTSGLDVMSLDIVDMANNGALIDSILLAKDDNGALKIFDGFFSESNNSFRESLPVHMDEDILPVSDLIRSKSNEICKGKKTDIDKAYAIYDWINKNIAYDSDSTLYNNISLLNPEEVLSKGYGGPYGVSLLYQALCNAQNIPCRTFVGNNVVSGGEVDAPIESMDEFCSAYLDTLYYAEAVWNEFYTTGTSGVGAGWYFVNPHNLPRLLRANGNIVKSTSPALKDYPVWGDYLSGVVDVSFDYSDANYFMPDWKDVNNEFVYSSLYKDSRVSQVTSNSSDWAKTELQAAAYSDILTDELLKGDYRVPATREYFCGILTSFMKADLYMYTDMEVDDLTAFFAENSAKAPIMKGVNSDSTKFCVGLGIVQGKGDDGFCPDDLITRAEACTIIYRMMNCMKEIYGGNNPKYDLTSFNEIPSNSYFADHNSIPDWALDGCYGCKDKGMVNGDDKGNFLPNDKLSCEQAIAIFNRLYAKN